jgi:hypothetical protein
MKQPVNKNIDRQKATAARNAIQRKKLIAAMILLTIMAVLWARMFIGKSKPASASASILVNPKVVSSPIPSGEVEYIKLPHIPQRHDAITNDFFSADNFSRFNRQEEVKADKQLNPSAATEKQFDSPAQAAAASLELIAIVTDSKKPQAYIGEWLLETGQSFDYTFHEKIYRFKVSKITADKVELDCNGIIITKRIPQPF